MLVNIIGSIEMKGIMSYYEKCTMTLYMRFRDEYSTYRGFAEAHGITEEQARCLISLGKVRYNKAIREGLKND